MSEPLRAAFGALGSGPTRRELGLVANALRESGDRDALALWDGPEYGPGYKRLIEIAEEAGASAFVALDLYVEVDNPGAISRLAGGTPVSRRVGRQG